MIRLSAHKAGVLSLAIDNNAETLASSGKDGVINVWNLNSSTASLSVAKTLKCGDRSTFVRSVSLSGHGQHVASCFEKKVTFWPSIFGDASPVVIDEGRCPFYRVRLSCDGDIAVAGSEDGSVPIVDVNCQTVIASVRHQAPVVGLSLSQNSKVVITATADGELAMWDLRSLSRVNVLATPRTSPSLLCVSRSIDDQVIASGDVFSNVNVYDLRHTRHHATFDTHSGAVMDIALNEAGNKIASSGVEGYVQIFHQSDSWSLQSVLHSNEKRGTTMAVAMSRDGCLVVCPGETGSDILCHYSRQLCSVSSMFRCRNPSSPLRVLQSPLQDSNLFRLIDSFLPFSNV